MRSPSCQRGMSLVLVLWLLALLLLIVPGFVYTMRVESAATASFQDEASAWALSVAGINRAAAEISADYGLVAVGEDGIVFLKNTDAGYKPLPAEREFGLGNGTVRYTIEDERAKINLNAAERSAISGILRLTGVDAAAGDIIADSLLDWRDEDHEFLLNGAEDDYYAGLREPYGAKDGPMNFTEELMLVKGMNLSIYYGSSGIPDWMGAEREGSYDGLEMYVTVYGDSRININTAGEPVLEATYGKGIPNEIVLKRKAQGYIGEQMHGGLVTSDVFRVISTGEKNGSEYRIEAAFVRKAGTGETALLSWREHGVFAR